MRNYRQELEAALDDVDAVVDRWMLASRSTHTNEARALLRDYKPRVMFYGVYNAGKSSLLNAMLGAEVAPTADAPCTSAIDEYQLGDYIVYDTPGLDAPQEHERVSREQLERCHVVLFVVSTEGTGDESFVILELRRVLDSGRAVLLVVHDKDALGLASDTVTRIRKNILRHLTIDGVLPANLSTFAANARSYANGVAQAKPALVAASGVPELVTAVQQRLRTLGDHQRLVPAASSLGIQLEEVTLELVGRISDGDATQYERVGKSLADTRTTVTTSAMSWMTSNRPSLAANLAQVMLHDGKGHRDLLERASERFFVVHEACLQGCLAQVASLAESICDVPRVVEGRSGVREGIPGEAGERIPRNATTNQPKARKPPGNSGTSTKVLKEAARGLRSKEGETLMKGAFLKLRQLKAPGFKGRWESTLGRTASKTAKGLGVALQVAVVAYDFKSALDAQRAEVRRLESEASARATAVGDCTSHFEKLLMDEVAVDLTHALAPVDSALEIARTTLTAEEAALQQDVALMRTHAQVVESLQFELRTEQPPSAKTVED